MVPFYIATIAVVLNFCLSFASKSSNPQQAVLENFYASSGGAGWANHSHWLEGEMCIRGFPGASKWHGVFCDSDGNVNALELIENNIGGTLPPELFRDLPWLERLNLAQNGLTGTIPETVCHCPHLRMLFLQLNTALTGTLPDCMSDLPRLERLVLELTDVGGTLPKRPFREARVLILSMSKFVGTIPDYFEQMPWLTTLIMNGQPEDENIRLSGTIPRTVFWLDHLEFISLQFNNLEGTLGDFSKMQNIRALHLNNNKLNGTIPDSLYDMLFQPLMLEELREGKLVKIASQKKDLHLHFEHNAFNGTIPGKIVELPDLTEFGVSDNQFSGYLPSRFEFPVAWRWYPENETAFEKNVFFPPVPDWAHTMGAPEGGVPLQLTSLYPNIVPRPMLPQIYITGENLVDLPELMCVYALPGVSVNLGGPVCEDKVSSPLCVTTKARLSTDMTYYTCDAKSVDDTVLGTVSVFIAHMQDDFKTGGSRTHIISNILSLVVYDPNPRITSIYPPAGRFQGCTTVTVTGQGFINTGQFACFFNTTKVPATYVNSTTITCPAPSMNESRTKLNVPLPFNITPNDGKTYSLRNDAIKYSYIPWCPLGSSDSEIAINTCECGLCTCSGFGTCQLTNTNPALARKTKPGQPNATVVVAPTGPKPDPGWSGAGYPTGLHPQNATHPPLASPQQPPLVHPGAPAAPATTAAHPQQPQGAPSPSGSPLKIVPIKKAISDKLGWLIKDKTSSLAIDPAGAVEYYPYCECHAGFTGEACELCQPGFYGSLCKKCPTCESGGVCEDGRSGTGDCICPAWFVGPTCHIDSRPILAGLGSGLLIGLIIISIVRAKQARSQLEEEARRLAAAEAKGKSGGGGGNYGSV